MIIARIFRTVAEALNRETNTLGISHNTVNIIFMICRPLNNRTLLNHPIKLMSDYEKCVLT